MTPYIVSWLRSYTPSYLCLLRPLCPKKKKKGTDESQLTVDVFRHTSIIRGSDIVRLGGSDMPSQGCIIH